MMGEPSPVSEVVAGERIPTPVLKSLPGGEGLPVILLHGYGSDSLSWLTLAASVTSVTRAVALDLPGHGSSGMNVGNGSVEALADAIAPLFDDAGFERFHLLGHSLGGAAALLLAARFPGRVASIALIAPVGLGRGVDPTFLDEYPLLEDAASTQALLQRLVVQPRLIGRPLVAGVLAQLNKTGSRAALRALGRGIEASESRLTETVAAVARAGVPRLVIWGEEDRINQPDAQKLDAFGGEYRSIPGAGHLPHVEQARAVGTIVQQFLARVTHASSRLDAPVD